MKPNIQKAELKITAGDPRQFPRDPIPQIAFSGRSNVGKSSLVNSLLGRKTLARAATPTGARNLETSKSQGYREKYIIPVSP